MKKIKTIFLFLFSMYLTSCQPVGEVTQKDSLLSTLDNSGLMPVSSVFKNEDIEKLYREFSVLTCSDEDIEEMENMLDLLIQEIDSISKKMNDQSSGLSKDLIDQLMKRQEELKALYTKIEATAKECRERNVRGGGSSTGGNDRADDLPASTTGKSVGGVAPGIGCEKVKPLIEEINQLLAKMRSTTDEGAIKEIKMRIEEIMKRIELYESQNGLNCI